jgi:hypothetical protein
MINRYSCIIKYINIKRKETETYYSCHINAYNVSQVKHNLYAAITR